MAQFKISLEIGINDIEIEHFYDKNAGFFLDIRNERNETKWWEQKSSKQSSITTRKNKIVDHFD